MSLTLSCYFLRLKYCTDAFVAVSPSVTCWATLPFRCMTKPQWQVLFEDRDVSMIWVVKYLSMYRAALRGLLKTLSAYLLTALTSSKLMTPWPFLSVLGFWVGGSRPMFPQLPVPHNRVRLPMVWAKCMPARLHVEGKTHSGSERC